jgi:hypothetical protein
MSDQTREQFIEEVEKTGTTVEYLYITHKDTSGNKVTR